MMNAFLRKLTCSSIGLCVASFALSLFCGGYAEIVLLAISTLLMAEVLLIAFLLLQLDAKMFAAMFFFFLSGRLCLKCGAVTASAVLFLATFALGSAMVLRFAYFMNKYCRREAEQHLDD